MAGSAFWIGTFLIGDARSAIVEEATWEANPKEYQDVGRYVLLASDLDGDGTEDLVADATGNPSGPLMPGLLFWFGEDRSSPIFVSLPAGSVGVRAAVVLDSDGDGRREIAVGDPL